MKRYRMEGFGGRPVREVEDKNATWVKYEEAREMLEGLKEAFDILDGVLGDADPQIDDSWTDEEIRDEYPVFHAAQLLIGAIKKAEASK